MSSDMILDVVIPCHNYSRYLDDCFNSILASTKLPDTVILVDDGSEDIDTVRSIATRYFHKFLAKDIDFAYRCVEFGNVHITRVHGYKYIRERHTPEVICFLDADDMVEPDYFALGLGCFNNRNNVGLVYSDMLRFNDNGENLDPWIQPEYKYCEQLDRIVEQNYIGAGSLVLGDAIEDSGAMKCGLPGFVHQTYADWYLWFNILSAGYEAVKQTGKYRYRVHEDSMMQTYLRNQKGPVVQR